jgi:hypothetical protein
MVVSEQLETPIGEEEDSLEEVGQSFQEGSRI